MPHNDGSAISLRPTLPLSGIRASVFQTLLVAMAVVLPLLAHVFGAPVRYILPMHWPVLLAGITYGWRSGAVTGMLAPLVSYVLSGFPQPDVLPSMTLELLTYGSLAGILREKRFNPFLAIAAAAVAGRIVFIAAALFTYTTVTDHAAYFQAALVPGLIAGAGQVALLPFLAKWWIGQEQRK